MMGDKPPDYSEESWILTIDGLVKNPLEFRWPELMGLPSVERKAPLFWGREAFVRWTGITVATLLSEAGIQSEASAVSFYAHSGNHSSLTLTEALDSRVFVAYRLQGAPLPKDNGGPLRLVVPFYFGYKWVKWLKRIHVTKEKELGHLEKEWGDNISVPAKYLEKYAKMEIDLSPPSGLG